MTLDITGGRELAQAFAAAARDIESAVTPVVSKGALNVKNDAVRRISGHPRSKHYPRTIGYDLTTDSSGVSADIGPDKDRPQGALGNILEFGTSKNAPIPHLGPALAAEEPKFIDALAAVAEATMLR